MHSFVFVSLRLCIPKVLKVYISCIPKVYIPFILSRRRCSSICDYGREAGACNQPEGTVCEKIAAWQGKKGLGCGAAAGAWRGSRTATGLMGVAMGRGAAEVPREQRHFGPRPRRAAGTGGHLHHDETAVALCPLDRTVRELRRGGWSATERRSDNQLSLFQ